MKTATYNRRAWWPDGWSVEKTEGRWCVVNKDTGKVLHRTEPGEEEVDAIVWADQWGDCTISNR